MTPIRRLARERGFTATAVTALALGLGVNIALFALVRGVLLRPLRYAAPQQLVAVREVIPAAARQFPTLPVNYASLQAWRRGAASFSGFALVHPAALNWRSSAAGAHTEQVTVDQVSANLFELLGVTPALGRGFVAGENTAGRNREVLLSHGFWQAHFGGNPLVVGRQIELDSALCTIVGVLPADFYFPPGRAWGTFVAAAAAGGEPQMFQPLVVAPQRRQAAGSFDFGALARLRPGVSRAMATAELDAITSHLMTSAGAASLQVRTRLTPLRQQVTHTVAQALWMLLGVMLVVLLLVCVNLGSLMLARAHARAGEAAIRLSLGASRGQLLRQALLEAGVLTVAGGLAGWLVAYACLQALLASAPLALPRRGEIHLDAAAAGFALVLALLAGVVCVAAPAWHWCQAEPARALRGANPRLAGSGRTRRWLLGTEAALASLVLVLAGLLLHSFIHLQQIEPGYSSAPKLLMATALAGPNSARRSYWTTLLPRVRSLPGVAAAGLTTELPLEGVGVTEQVDLPGDTRPAAERPIVNVQFVSSGYFTALGVALQGRDFSARDLAKGAPQYVIVSREAARRLWPGASALGKRFRLAGPGGPVVTVIGVAANVRTNLQERAGPILFQPLTEALARHLVYLVVQPEPGLKPLSLAPAVRAALYAVQPLAAVPTTQTMAALRAGLSTNRRFELVLALLFALGALALAVLGIYGIASYTLTQQRRELAVRSALGAAPSRLAVWMLRQSLLPVLAGLVVGAGGGAFLGRLLATQLYGVPPADPWTLGLTALALCLAALLAAAAPARRAARLPAWEHLRA